MPRYIFPAGSVTNTTGAPLRLTFHRTSTSGRRETNLFNIDGSSNLTTGIPNGVILTDAAGAYSTFAGPDDVTALYVDTNIGSARTLVSAGTSVPTAEANLRAAYAGFVNLARSPDLLITGAVTRDTNSAATAATVTWPDGTTGTYTATTVSTAFPGAVDAYTITYGSPATRTYTQAAVTRDANGVVTSIPAIAVS